MSLPSVTILSKADKRVVRGHPWIYSNEVAMTAETKALVPGGLVQFRTHDGRSIGQGSFNPHCLIAGRIFSRNIVDNIDQDWLRKKLRNALSLREKLLPAPYYRLVHAEADSLPGLIIDRFNDILTVQQNTAGMENLGPLLIPVLLEELKPSTIVLRNDSPSRTLEGLPRDSTIVHGTLTGLTPVLENNLTYFADLAGGQKTGWYFDQRDNHALLADLAQKAPRVLDLYCHAGGFALPCAHRGAREVLGIDSSEAALALAEKALAYNKIKGCRFLRGDVFEELEKLKQKEEVFEVVIADPPAFIKSKKDLMSGARGYRKLAKLAAHVTAPQGMLFLVSCSHNISLEQFTLEIAAGLHEARREARILKTTFAATDHPVHPQLPESAYLKALLLRLD